MNESDSVGMINGATTCVSDPDEDKSDPIRLTAKFIHEELGLE